MKKFFLMFILTSTFLNAEIIKNNGLLKLTNSSYLYCVKSYNLSLSVPEFYITTSYNPTVYTKTNIENNRIEYFYNTGYEWDTIKATCTLSPIPPPEPEPEPEPNPNPTNPPITITPDENGLIMGLTPQNFHFSFALWGVALSFLMAIGLILSF